MPVTKGCTPSSVASPVAMLRGDFATPILVSSDSSPYAAGSLCRLWDKGVKAFVGFDGCGCQEEYPRSIERNSFHVELNVRGVVGLEPDACRAEENGEVAEAGTCVLPSRGACVRL